jgi:hypothetical protein
MARALGPNPAYCHTDRRIGAKSNYFQHRENAGFKRARARCFRCGRTERPTRACPPKQGEGARKRRGPRSWTGFRSGVCAHEAFLVRQDGEDHSSLPALNSMREPGRCEAGSWMGLRSGARARCFGSGRTERTRRLGPADKLVGAGPADRAGNHNGSVSTRGLQVRRAPQRNEPGLGAFPSYRSLRPPRRKNPIPGDIFHLFLFPLPAINQTASSLR